MKRYPRLLFPFLIAAGLYCTTQVAGTTDETESGIQIYGYLIDYTDNKPVADAMVRLYASNDTGTITVNNNPVVLSLDSTRTDTKGKYLFDSVAAGNYNVEAWIAHDADTLQVHTSVAHGSGQISGAGSATYVGVDTLKFPGGISGRVTFEWNGKPDVWVYIPGTPFLAVTDGEGRFSIRQVPAGSYVVTYWCSGFRRAFDSSVVVLSGETTVLEGKSLVEDSAGRPPVPVDVQAIFIPFTQEVTVSWSPVTTEEVAGYSVVRKDTAQTALEPQRISGDSTVTATAYHDTLAEELFAGSDTVTLQYQVQSIAADGTGSLLSESVYVTVYRITTVRKAANLDSLITGDVTLMPDTDTVTVPYTVTVSDGAILRITPGTVLQFDDSRALIIKGRLLAEGNPFDSIVFTGTGTSTRTGWNGIRFDSVGTGNDTSKVTWCRIEKGMNTTAGRDSGNGGAIYCNRVAKLVIANNTITGNVSDNSGGAIYCSASSPLITGNAIIGNRCSNMGGGIYCGDSGSPVIEYNKITGNRAGSGGGIFSIGRSAPVISRNTITYDTADGNAGGICFLNDSAAGRPVDGNLIANNLAANGGGGIFWGYHIDFTSNIVTENTALSDAGGLDISNGSMNITNCVIAGNHAVNGAGLRSSGTLLRVVNSTIANNNAKQDGGAVVYEGNDSMVVDNSIIWGNSAVNGTPFFILENIDNGKFGIKFRYTCVQDERRSENGNITFDPAFADPANGDFSLQGRSPCIDAGSNDLVPYKVTMDIAGNTRIANGTVDMGAYEQ